MQQEEDSINSERYVQTLKKFKQRIRRVRPNWKANQVLLLHDNARPHTSLLTREATATMEWIVLLHPPYSPDLAPSDFHLFDPLKDALRGRRFADDDELKHSVREELRSFSK
jgi:histone-lysine N-methyltransferase SETMAR